MYIQIWKKAMLRENDQWEEFIYIILLKYLPPPLSENWHINTVAVDSRREETENRV